MNADSYKHPLQSVLAAAISLSNLETQCSFQGKERERMETDSTCLNKLVKRDLDKTDR